MHKPRLLWLYDAAATTVDPAGPIPAGVPSRRSNRSEFQFASKETVLLQRRLAKRLRTKQP